MKFAPQLMVGLTASAALAAGALLAAEDRMAFDTPHAMLGEVVEQAVSTWVPPAAPEARRVLPRPTELRASDRGARPVLPSGVLGAADRP